MQNVAPTFHDSSRQITEIGNGVSNGANNMAGYFANTKRLTVPQFISLIGIIAGIAGLHQVDKVMKQGPKSKPLTAVAADIGNEALQVKDSFVMWKDTRFNSKNEDGFSKAVQASVAIAAKNKKPALIASIN